MHGQITNAGIAAIKAAGGPPVIPTAIIGSGYNYIPEITDTGIHGTELFSTAPSVPQIENANLVRYSVYLDHNVGDFEFGEVALMMGSGTLFGLFASSELIDKLNISNGASNSVRIDIYLSIVGENYTMWADLSQSDSQMRIPVVNSVDQLPPSKDARPNIYIVPGITENQSPTIAYTDQRGLWTFDAYAYSSIQNIAIVRADSDAVYISADDFNSDLVPGYLGDVIVEFGTGQLYGICRNVESVNRIDDTYQIRFITPLMELPVVGDSIISFSRNARSVDNLNLPTASKTQLGIMRVGNGLAVNSGLVSVDIDSLKQVVVVSVNGKSGEVILKADDIDGISKVGKDNLYSSLSQIPSTFNPPIATSSTLGGVKVGPQSQLQIDAQGNLSLGISPVLSVNGQTGNVTINKQVGLVDPTNIEGESLNNLYTVGLFYGTWASIGAPFGYTEGTVEVIPFLSEIVLQRVTPLNVASSFIRWVNITTGATTEWSTGVNLPIATTTTIGGISVGTGLSIDSSGSLSADVTSVNGRVGVVTITAAELGAIPTSRIGTPGGVANLTDDPDPEAHPVTSEFVYGRTPEGTAPIGTLQFIGNWNASTNTVEPIDIDGFIYNVRLSENGQLKAWSSDEEETTSEEFTIEGAIVQVSVAGDTSLDGIDDWRLDDIIVSLNGKWQILQREVVIPPAPEPVLPSSSEHTIEPEDTLDIPLVNAHKKLINIRVENPTGVWQDVSLVPELSVTYSESGISIVSTATMPLNIIVVSM